MKTRLIVFIALLSLITGDAASTKILYRPGDWVSYSTLRFVSAVAAGSQYVYFATTGGVSRYDLFRDAWADPLTTSDGLPDNHVGVVAVDPLFNDLWCATRRGVSRYNEATQRWTTYTSGGGLFLTDIHSIGITGDDRMLFESPSGLAVFDLARAAWIAPEEGNTPFSQGFSDVRWYGLRDRRPYEYPLFQTDHDYLFDPPESIRDRYVSYPITGFHEDAFGHVWIGTWGLNAGKASLRSWRMTMERVGLYHRNVNAIRSDGDAVWFGGLPDRYDVEGGSRFLGQARHEGGITRFNPVTREWTYFVPLETDGLPTGFVAAIVSDTASVWFGTEAGVVVYDKTDDRWTPLPLQPLTSPEVTSLALTRTDLWVGTRSGINQVERRTRLIRPVSIAALRDVRIYDIAVDEQQTVWFASNHGVYQRSAGGAWKKIEDADTANLNGPVFDIEMDGVHIWFAIGTALLKYHRTTGAWEQYLLPLSIGDGPLRMSVTDRMVWLGARRGAARFEKARASWKVYTARDGLIDETVQAILPDGDYIWFGTPAGVTRFRWHDPARVE